MLAGFRGAGPGQVPYKPLAIHVVGALLPARAGAHKVDLAMSCLLVLFYCRGL